MQKSTLVNLCRRGTIKPIRIPITFSYTVWHEYLLVKAPCDHQDIATLSSADAPSVKERRENGKESENGEIKKSGGAWGTFPSPQLPRALFPSPHSPAYRKDERDICGLRREILPCLLATISEYSERKATKISERLV